MPLRQLEEKLREYSARDLEKAAGKGLGVVNILSAPIGATTLGSLFGIVFASGNVESARRDVEKAIAGKVPVTKVMAGYYKLYKKSRDLAAQVSKTWGPVFTRRIAGTLALEGLKRMMPTIALKVADALGSIANTYERTSAVVIEDQESFHESLVASLSPLGVFTKLFSPILGFLGKNIRKFADFLGLTDWFKKKLKVTMLGALGGVLSKFGFRGLGDIVKGIAESFGREKDVQLTNALSDALRETFPELSKVLDIASPLQQLGIVDSLLEMANLSGKQAAFLEKIAEKLGATVSSLESIKSDTKKQQSQQTIQSKTLGKVHKGLSGINTLLTKVFGWLKDVFLFKFLFNLFKTPLSWIGSLIEKLVSAIGWIFKAPFKLVGAVGRGVLKLATGAAGALGLKGLGKGAFKLLGKGAPILGLASAAYELATEGVTAKSVGSVAGGVLGAALGSAFGPLGTIAGGFLGSKLGEFAGSAIGSLFSTKEESKKEESEMIEKVQESNEQAVSVLETSLNQMIGIWQEIKEVLEKMKSTVSSIYDFLKETPTAKPHFLPSQASYAVPLVTSTTSSTDTLSKIAMLESRGNPLAKASTSSAAGMYQITEGTWKNITKKMYGTALSAELRYDPELSRKVAETLLQENREAFLRRGIAPTEANLYLAHFLGIGRAIELLSNPNAKLGDVLPEEVFQSNKFLKKEWTVADLKDEFQRRALRLGVYLSDVSTPTTPLPTVRIPQTVPPKVEPSVPTIASQQLVTDLNQFRQAVYEGVYKGVIDAFKELGGTVRRPTPVPIQLPTLQTPTLLPFDTGGGGVL